MKKLLLLLILMATILSGCYVEPIRDHDGAYQRDQDHRDNERDHNGGDDGGGHGD